MAKKKLNQLDPATITAARLIGHADPSTGKMNRATVGQLISLFTANTPVKTYADETELLANTDLVVGYLALQADTGKLYLYNGPTPDDIDNYTEVGVNHFRGSHDLSTEAYPSSGGTGSGGIPVAGDQWYGINSGDFDVEGLDTITLERGALLIYIGGTVSDPASWIVKQ